MLMVLVYPGVTSRSMEAFLKGLSKVELLILQNSTGQRLVSWGISFVSPSLTPAFLQHIKAAEHILSFGATNTHSSKFHLSDTCF